MKRIIVFNIIVFFAASYAHAAIINVALNDNVTVTVPPGREEPGKPANHIIDGNYSTQWGSGSSSTVWAIVDLAQISMIDSVNIIGVNTGRASWLNYTVYYDLFTSLDQSLWDLVGSGILYDNPDWAMRSNSYNLDKRKARYIKFQSTGGSHWPGFNELEVYAQMFIITSPGSNALLHSGQEYDVKWQTFGIGEVETVTLEISSDNKNTWSLIAASIPNINLYNWTIPGGIASDQCYIRISDAAYPHTYHISDAFIIYTDSLKKSLQLNKQEFGQIDGSIGFQLWSFSALVGQQVRLQNLSSSGSAVSYDLTGPHGWQGFTGLTNESGLVTLTEAGNYTLIARSTAAGENIVYSFVLNETTQTELPFDTVYKGSFTGNGQAELFRITVENGHSMHIKLDDAASDNYNELYLKRDLPPTRGNYDYRHSNLASSDPDILILSATPGDWYLLVYGNTINSPSKYALIAEKKPIILSEISPKIHGDIIDTVFTLTGAGFEHMSQVNLVADANSYQANSIEVVGDGKAYATFIAKTVPAGVYSAEVVHEEEYSDRLDSVFEMVEGGLPNLETNLILPSRLGYHHLATIYVEYSNTGYASMPAPVLVLKARQKGTEAALLTLDKSLLSTGFWTSATPEGFDTSVQILASGDTPGVLYPGETKRVPVYYAGWLQPWDFSYPRIEFSLSVLDTTNTVKIDWDRLEFDISPRNYDLWEWKATFAKIKQLVGSTWGQYCQLIIKQAKKHELKGEAAYDVRKLFSEILDDAYILAMFHGRTIVGHVYLKDNGEPVSGAKVVAYAQDGIGMASTVTDSDGWYVFQTLKPGVFELEVEDYLLASDVMVNMDGTQQLYTADLPVLIGGSINGTITDINSIPLNSVMILARELDTSDEIYYAKSSETGKYEIDALPKGTYEIYCEAEGYVIESTESILIDYASTINVDFELDDLLTTSSSAMITDALSEDEACNREVQLLTGSIATDEENSQCVGALDFSSNSTDYISASIMPSGLRGTLEQIQAALHWNPSTPPELPLTEPTDYLCPELFEDQLEIYQTWWDLTQRIKIAEQKRMFLIEEQTKLDSRLATYKAEFTATVEYEGNTLVLNVITPISLGSYIDAWRNGGELAAVECLKIMVLDALKIASGLNAVFLAPTAVEHAGRIFIELNKYIELSRGAAGALITWQNSYDKSIKILNEEYLKYEFARVVYEYNNQKCEAGLKPKPQNDFYQTTSNVPIGYLIETLLVNDLPDPSKLSINVPNQSSSKGAKVYTIGDTFMYEPQISSVLAGLYEDETVLDQFYYDVIDREHSDWRAKGVVFVSVRGILERTDSDDDGSPDDQDYDDDNDGIPDWEECANDADCDGITDDEDPDDDNDDIPDEQDNDDNGNGIPDDQENNCYPPFDGECNKGEVRTDCGCVPDVEDCDPPFIGPCLPGEVRTDCGCKPDEDECDPPFQGPCNEGEIATPCGCKPEPCTDCGGGTPDPNTTGGGGGGSTGSAGSMDPNKKTGPAGHKEQGFIKPGLLMPYKVEFENDPKATVPAQIVTVDDQLSSHLDWRTFELTEIAFGKHIIPVPPKTQYFGWTEPMHYDGLDFEVKIEAGIRLSTGQVYATFFSIDPSIGLPPGIDHGFLPPEDGTGRGMGHFSYVIRQKPDLPSGTEIRNIAYITFDFAETIATNQVDPHDPAAGTDPNLECLNTIDAGLPESYIGPLPAESLSPFVLFITGQDDVGGSGIGSYDIYVSTNGSPFTLWKTTLYDSIEFDGEIGSTYAFYSVAKDNAGNYEDRPQIADTSTTVVHIGDINGDGRVDFEDLAILCNDWLRGNSLADIAPPPDGDGIVDLADFTVIAENWLIVVDK